MLSFVAPSVAAVKHSQTPTGCFPKAISAQTQPSNNAFGYRAPRIFGLGRRQHGESTFARMSDVTGLSLADLPLAWLHRFSTFLTAEAAARLRSTCRLLQKVVDATWEPVEVPVPPHRRSVPLTFEQVKAQLPAHKPWPQKWLEVAEAQAHRPNPSAWVDDCAAAAAATLDPLIAAAIAAASGRPADGGVGPSSSSGGIAGTAAEPGMAFWSEVSPRLSVLDYLPTDPRDKFTFDASACDSAQLQQLAERFRPLGQAEGSSSAASVRDYIRQLLTPQYSSSEDGVSFGSTASGGPPGRWSRGWGSSDLDDEDPDAAPVYEDGCDTYWSDIFGPALTRLTANQAANILQGKPMLMFESPWNSDLGKYSTVWERMKALGELNFENLRVGWPPRQDKAESNEGFVSRSCQWDCSAYQEMVLCGRVNVPVEVREERAKDMLGPCQGGREWWCESYVARPSTEEDWLLVTTDSSCRDATVMEREQFEFELTHADTATTGDRFDMYLSFHKNCGFVDVYVFLAPCVCRLTGRPISTTQVEPGGDA